MYHPSFAGGKARFGMFVCLVLYLVLGCHEWAMAHRRKGLATNLKLKIAEMPPRYLFDSTTNLPVR